MLLSLTLEILSVIHLCGGEDVHETCTGLGLAEAVTPLPYSVLCNVLLFNN